MIKVDTKALKDNVKGAALALNSDGKAFKGDVEVRKINGEASKGDGEVVKDNGEAFRAKKRRLRETERPSIATKWCITKRILTR